MAFKIQAYPHRDSLGTTTFHLYKNTSNNKGYTRIGKNNKPRQPRNTCG